MIERLLRWTAITIAVLAFADPTMTLAGRVRSTLSVVVLDGPSMARTDNGGQSRKASADRVRDSLARDLSADFDSVDGLDTSAAAVVVIGDRYPDEAIAARAKVSTVTVGGADARGVFIDRLEAPRAVPPATSVRVRLEIVGIGVRGEHSLLSVRANDGAEVARAVHAWTGDRETWRADFDVVPVGSGPFVFNARVSPDEASSTTPVNTATATVEIAPRHRVLVVEWRPSWATAFLRRALEGDPRFDVSGVSAAAPRVEVTTGTSPALPSDPRSFDVIIVGGLDRLPSGAPAILDRFIRERGGSLVLVPDAQIPAGVARHLLPGITLRETLTERATALETAAPALQASELLEASALPRDAHVIATAAASHAPVVWSIPAGDGRVVVSGAMDAWRYRADGRDPQFDRFWRSLVSGAALAAAPALDVRLSPNRAAAGERVHVSVRVRRLERDRLGDALAVAARVGDTPIRLWPDAALGVFTGSFVKDEGVDSQTVIATLDDGTSGSALLTNDTGVRERSVPPLSVLAGTHGGIDVTPSTLSALEQHLRRTIPPESTRVSRRPMRSPWWFAPFAGCLSAEWWLRRRRGAR